MGEKTSQSRGSSRGEWRQRGMMAQDRTSQARASNGEGSKHVGEEEFRDRGCQVTSSVEPMPDTEAECASFGGKLLLLPMIVLGLPPNVGRN